MIKRVFPLFILLASSVIAFSQAGYGVYQFMELPASSRLTALGNTNISLRDNDLNFAFANPALLTSETHNVVGLNVANYLADITFGSAIYGRTIGTKNYLAVGIQYIDYGSMRYADELNSQSDYISYFSGKEMAVNIMYARPLTDKITVGATLKPINSVLERYNSFGVALDAGVSYNDPAHLFSAGLVLRNMGTQLKGYYADGSEQHFEPLPMNIELGVSKKLAHAPLRFSLTLHNLQHFDLNYESTNQPTSSLTTTTTKASDATVSAVKEVDMAFRHAIIAVEFVPSKNFYLTVGYNHRRQQEMTVSGFKGMSGFSFGGGIKLYKFHVGFGTTQFLPGNSSYHFSISTALNEFRL